MGTSCIDWETFSRHRQLGHLQRLFDLMVIKSSYELYKKTSQVMTESTSFLSQTLNFRQGLGVSDPRDMIFGHLGLCAPVHKDAMQSHIPVDYGKSVTDLYEDVARQIMLDANDIFLLANVESVPLEDRRTGLPSWVPDWTVRNNVSTFYKRTTGISHITLMEEKTFEYAHVLTLSGTRHGAIKLLLPDPSGSTGRDDFSGLHWEMSELEILSWAAKPESWNTANAIFTSFRETCKNLHIPIWEDQRERYQARTIVSRLYASSQGEPEDNTALLPADLATILVNMFMNLRGEHNTKYNSDSITAFLNTGRVMVVPPLARKGDILCVMDRHGRECILRPCESPNPTLVKQKEDGVAENVLLVTLAPISKFPGDSGWELVFGSERVLEDRKTTFNVH
ncbi:hypothetical protein BKA65DRAFT_479525 [Rhexocercosporidium sp. MPI-PUGE-AT-0058]|nr:hypothetical protein BKA65DRAFT_479525 [Rhexocercosporidium sp. MPI-PUGE-AT-0058]